MSFYFFCVNLIVTDSVSSAFEPHAKPSKIHHSGVYELPENPIEAFKQLQDRMKKFSNVVDVEVLQFNKI